LNGIEELAGFAERVQMYLMGADALGALIVRVEKRMLNYFLVPAMMICATRLSLIPSGAMLRTA
jgi:hypothetical protein